MAAVINLGAAAWRDETASRYNIYRAIHKGLRGFMTDTLLRVGRMDVNDECERNQAIEQVRGLLAMCEGHLVHENEYVHPAIDAVVSGGADETAADHVGHIVAIRTLQQQIAQFEAANGAKRVILAAEIYLDLSTFVAENFEHMAVEETHNHAALARNYSDEEMRDIEHRIVASMTPEQSLAGLRWMLPHVNADERAHMLGGMKAGAPAEVFERVMGLAREVLTQRDFYKLERALA
ncbi:hemerythrin-like domain-containing protein [Povalibacter uvarum]|uniref:Hemerythrin-like domain-containing protein n=1 Tax=Povalibacter uvarum TaxID=732238 RepID=A0A841HIR2_9GAMM|nr:hemerythrin domain-containing protein [Povalibacter uvarum]MBB6092603.1 hemerythrin-like domain-containing protein [Povalibacter uvarum]